MGLPYGENFIILTSTVLVRFTLVTDRQTDGETDGRTIAYRAICYMLLSVKNSAGTDRNGVPQPVSGVPPRIIRIIRLNHGLQRRYAERPRRRAMHCGHLVSKTRRRALFNSNPCIAYDVDEASVLGNNIVDTAHTPRIYYVFLPKDVVVVNFLACTEIKGRKMF